MNKSLSKRWLGLSGAAGGVAGRRGLLARADLREARRQRAGRVQGNAARNDARRVREAGTWKTAQPSEEMMRGEWWTIFDDATLNDLEQQAPDANQNLKAAAARVKEARAINQTARAGLFPTLDAGFGPTREKLSPASQFLPPDARTCRRRRCGARRRARRMKSICSAAWLDRAMRRRPTRSKAKRCSARCSSRCRRTSRRTTSICANSMPRSDVFTRTVTLREQALKLVQRRFNEGDISELDVARAKSELATARSDAMTVQRLRAASEHSLAVLLGKAPARVLDGGEPAQAGRRCACRRACLRRCSNAVPISRRRSARWRRRMRASAWRRRRSSRRSTLTGAGGFESATLGDLFKWSSRTFLLGPFAGTALNDADLRRRPSQGQSRECARGVRRGCRELSAAGAGGVPRGGGQPRRTCASSKTRRATQDDAVKASSARGAAVAHAVHRGRGELSRRDRRGAHGAAVAARGGATCGARRRWRR